MTARIQKPPVTMQGVRGTATEDALDAVIRFDRRANGIQLAADPRSGSPKTT